MNMHEFDNDEELVNPHGEQSTSSADLNLPKEQFRTDSVVDKREEKCIVSQEIIELDDDDDECREGPGNMRSIDSAKLVDTKVSRKSSVFLKEKKDVVPIETVDLDIDNDDEDSIQSSLNTSDVDTTDIVEEKHFLNDNTAESHSSLNDVPSTASQDISSIRADIETETAVKQGSSRHYYVNCEHCSLEEIRSDRYIYHCSKFHAEFFKDTKVQCNICRKLVHHVLTNHHAKMFHDGETSVIQSSETSEDGKRWSYRLFFLEVSPERGAKTSQSKCMKCLLCKNGKLLHA